MTKPYRLVEEVFSSIQGEGFWAGTPAIFVRLTGCSVTTCPIRAACDTEYDKFGVLASLEDIYLAAEADRASSIAIITGGEPLDHDLAPLANALARAGKRVHIETSGMRAVPSALRLDWVTVSPKGRMAALAQSWANECKVVYTGQPDAVIREYEGLANHYFLQPLWKPGDVNLTATYEAIRRLGEPWRFSAQLHKIAGVR